MKYLSFKIESYRAIKRPIVVDLTEYSLLPFIGINECGKTTILQSIFAFDHYNDDLYDGKHLEDTTNLYETLTKEPLISATIELPFEDLSEIWNGHLREINEEELQDVPDELWVDESSFSNSLTISRNLETLEYSIDRCKLEKKIQNQFARAIVSHAPFILYNDDFQDRPPSRISIPSDRPLTLAPWLSIYEQLFKETEPDYSLLELTKIENELRRKSIVSDVEAKLNQTLTSAWRSFQLDSSRDIRISLDFRPANADEDAVLEVYVVEKMGGKDRHFLIPDRSKGFLWFYNFVMKLEFNPKVTGSKENTIHLLDEPGCYLHALAQTKLCAKLKSISERNGIVIYCTHSHKLLDPDHIPLNSIQIVKKSDRKIISVKSLSEYKTSGPNVTATQPILEALQLSFHEILDPDKTVIVVEGIYDKYAISLFMEDSEDFCILPSTNANAIVKNIQILNAFNVEYVAIWDNDGEGRKEKDRATKFFGTWEASKFDMLPSKGGGNDRKMEDMFLEEDFSTLRSELKLNDNSHYESIVGTLYHLPKNKKKEIIDKVSSSTKENFKILRGIVSKRLVR